MNDMTNHFAYYTLNGVLTFRTRDGRTGSEPLALKNETVGQCVNRLAEQLGLDETCTFEELDRTMTTNKEQQALNDFRVMCDEHKGDTEYLHWAADEFLCKLLEADYPELVEQFKALDKWYA